jgi:hypothetical protein
MKKILCDPLVHFLLIGAGLFLLFGWKGGSAPMPAGPAPSSSPEIVMTRGDIEQLIDTFRRTWQRAPAEEEIDKLVEDFVRDEIFYREAMASGLGHDDSVIRRRMRLMMEFMFEDISSQAEPTEQDLLKFMEAHIEAYRVDPQIGFQQVFIDTDRRGEQAETDTLSILARLAAGADPTALGDTFLLGAAFPPAPLWEIQGQFGEAFGKALLELPPDQWSGPLQSAYGLHLVRIGHYTPALLPELDDIREKIKLDWAVAHQQQMKDEAYARLKQRYKVTVELPPSETVTASQRAAPGR